MSDRFWAVIGTMGLLLILISTIIGIYYLLSIYNDVFILVGGFGLLVVGFGMTRYAIYKHELKYGQLNEQS